MIRFASLGSGSKGNATLIESGTGASDTRLLLDCGYSVVETERRLSRLERSAGDITAIMVTHEHADHISGVARLSRKYDIPVWLTVGTWNACRDIVFSDTHFINSHAAFSIGDIQLNPFPVPHDAREPCQFVFSDGACELGIVTDLGCYTPHIIKRLSRLKALLLECNYDHAMLLKGEYPVALKQRVASPRGHLDNRQSSELLKKIDTTQLNHLIGMHVSEKNNQPEFALDALCDGVGCERSDVSLACQVAGFGWREIR